MQQEIQPGCVPCGKQEEITARGQEGQRDAPGSGGRFGEAGGMRYPSESVNSALFTGGDDSLGQPLADGGDFFLGHRAREG
jgi:hypothetical protein